MNPRHDAFDALLNAMEILALEVISEEPELWLRCISEVGDRESRIIRLRYPLNGRRPLNQTEIARRLKLSRARISQLEWRGLLRLRKAAARDQLIDAASLVRIARKEAARREALTSRLSRVVLPDASRVSFQADLQRCRELKQAGLV